MHDAVAVRAVDHAEGMSQLMDGLFEGAFRQQARVGRQAVVLLPKQVERDDSRPALLAGLAENKVQPAAYIN